MPADSYTEWRTTKAKSLLDCQGGVESLITQVPHAEVGQVNLWSVSLAELGTVVVWPSRSDPGDSGSPPLYRVCFCCTAAKTAAAKCKNKLQDTYPRYALGTRQSIYIH